MADENLLQNWTDKVIKAVSDAGFTVKEFNGLPLVDIPQDLNESVRLLKLPLPDGGVKNLYAEGMLITPHIIDR
jgi:hypothetical protein